MNEHERIAQSVVGGLLVAAVAGALVVGCSKPDEKRPCERRDRIALSVAAGPGPAPRPPAPAPVQKVPSLQKEPAAPAPQRRGPRAAVPDVPGSAAQPTASPSPSATQTRRHLDLCDD
ncbi:hypothetical protein [Streptomyces griseus]|uniref:hypothetical protein n=1 Tax=Streptomyces griseus TaxID=1911 RepID=UPI00117C31AD|nr:hypothetical protein [Streptomyces fimicarius]